MITNKCTQYGLFVNKTLAIYKLTKCLVLCRRLLSVVGCASPEWYPFWSSVTIGLEGRASEFDKGTGAKGEAESKFSLASTTLQCDLSPVLKLNLFLVHSFINQGSALL